jgi:integrase
MFLGTGAPRLDGQPLPSQRSTDATTSIKEPTLPRQLNAHTLDAIKPPTTGQAFYFDAKVKGLALRIGASGAKSWTLTARLGGRSFRYVLGPCPAWDIQRARAAALAAQADIAAGIDPRRPQLRTLTIRELLEKYAEQATHRSAAIALTRIYRGLPSEWLDRPALSITRDQVDILRRQLGQRGPYCSNGFVRHLRAVYNKAIDLGWLPEGTRNPAARHDEFKERPRDRILRREEFPRLFEALRTEPNVCWRAYFALPLLIGTRRNELVRAKWSDIKDLDGERPILRIPQNKSDRPLELPLVPEAAQLLRELPRYNEYIFASKRGGHLTQPQGAWQRIRARAGLGDVHIHDLRRTCSSLLGHRGASFPLIGAVLNHADPQTTKDAYVVWEDNPVRDALAAHAEGIMALAAAGK